MQSTLATAKEPQIAMCQVTDAREYLILGRETAQQAKGYIAWSCIPRGVPGLCEQCLTSQKHRCPATELTLGSLSKSLRRPLLRRLWMRCPGKSTSRSSPNFQLGSWSLAFDIIYQQQNSMVVK